MFELISQNRSWLFDGAGVAIITGLVALGYRWQQRRKKSGGVTTSGAPGLSFTDIANAYKDTPPLQTKHIGNRFKDVFVTWDAQIFNMAVDSNDLVRLTLHFGALKPGLVICRVPLSEYRELAYLKRETRVVVSGVIDETDSSMVTLRDATLKFV